MMNQVPHYCTLVVVILHIVMIVCVPINKNEYHHNSDVCDWEGSGNQNTDSERVVVPVYLRCTHGTIKWIYPKGGLRVVLRHGTSNKDFRGCIRVAKNTSNVRMYIEGHRQLHKLYASDDGKHSDLLRCFVSNDGQIAIFLESEPWTSKNGRLNRDVVRFDYHLQSVSSQEELLHDYSECRPCDDLQLVSTFCTSDFIIEGTISSLYHNLELERSELTIRARKVIKDPVDYNINTLGNDSAKDLYNNSEYGIVKYFTLHRPLKCGTKAGSGTEFLFFGRWVLGNPVISCAPKIEYWKHVKSKAIESGLNQCQLV